MWSLDSETNLMAEGASLRRTGTALALFEGPQGLTETIRLVERVGGVGLWKWDMATGDMEWSPGFWHLLDLAPGVLKPSFRHLVSMMHPDDRAANAEIEALALKGLPLDRRFRIILSDGRLRWLEQRGEVLFDREGRPSKAVGIFLDVTTRQETLHAVRTRAERYLALRTAVSEIVILTHADGSVIDLLEWCKVTGQSITTVSHAFWLDAVHPEDRAAAQKKWDEARQLGAPFRTEVRVMFASDGVRWMILKGAPVTDDHGVVQEWIVTLADANEVKPAQNQSEGPQLLSGAQIRAARAILNWSVRDLAEKAAVPVSTIRRLEEFDGILDTPPGKAAAIRTTLEQAGCEFVFPRTGKPGVRPR